MHIRRFTDRLASLLIKTGGVLLIVVVLSIIGFIGYQAFPLWESASLEPGPSVSLASVFPGTAGRDILFIGEEEQREIQYFVAEDKLIYCLSMRDNKPRMMTALTAVGGERLTAADAVWGSHEIAATDDAGEVVIADLQFRTEFGDTGRTIFPEIVSQKKWNLRLPAGRITSIRAASTESGFVLGGILTRSDSSQAFAAILENGVEDAAATMFDSHVDVAVIALSHHGQELAFGTREGVVEVYGRDDLSKARYSIHASDRGITALEYVLGDVTLLVADGGGRLRGWMPVDTNGERMLSSVHDLGRGEGSTAALLASWRNKSFVVLDDRNAIRLFHLTSRRLLAEFHSPTGMKKIYFSPKADGLLLLDRDHNLVSVDIDSRHPETTIQTLFGRIWYESYNEPTFTWQSSAGTDDFEPKLSMVPLIFGTIKGTLYAMVFAIPLAILGALYTSQFAHPRIRTIVKPTVEIMAALPSVVIGLLAGLWLAPLMEHWLVAVVLMCVGTPLGVMIVYILFSRLPARWTGYVGNGRELTLLIPVLLVMLVISFLIGSVVESGWMGGSASNWLREALGINYDQRNCIVVGIAMAFAVMPIIFTIAEDSLSSVPAHLTSASLALGATRWQTAIKVVLPAASAGIFSAIMIGFGRAVGETMIVLMATGNTPIMDWSIFNGMRTLSANIAVEIPEAPHGGTLYRVLFLSGAILFLMTFFVNTLAEVVRQRLRKKYATMV